MSDIAKGAHIAVGTLYLYFDSKDAIARALAAQAFSTAAAVILPLFERRLTRKSITVLVARIFDVAAAIPTAGQSGYPVSDVHSTLASDAFGAAVGQIAAALERQMDEGWIRRYDAPTLADYMVILLRRAVLLSGASDGAREPFESTLAEMFCGALL